MLFYLLQGAALALSAVVMPGPFQVYLLSQALKQGWKRTLPAALAPLATDGPIVALVLFVLTQMPPWLIEALRIAGGLFILYLAKGIVANLRKAEPSLKTSTAAAHQTFIQAVIMNFLNPSIYIWWSVIGGPIVLSGWMQSPSLGIAFFTGFYGVFICSLATLIILFSSAGSLNQRVNRALSIVAAFALLAFGLYQIMAGIRGLY